MSDTKTKPPYRPSFTIDSFLHYSTQLVTFGLAFISSIIIARILGPDGKGIYAFVFLVPAIASTIIKMGINSSSVYFIGKRRFAVNRIVGNALFYSISSGTLIAVFLLAFVPFINRYYNQNAYSIYLYLTIPLIPFLLTIENIYYVLLALRKMILLSGFRIIRPFIYVLSLILFYYFLRLSVYTAITANIIAMFSALFFGFYVLIRDRKFTGLVVDKEILKETIKYGAKQHLGTIFQFFNYRVDMLIIAALLTQADLGLYSISVLIAEMVWYLPNSIGQILFTKTSTEKESANQFTPLICRSIFLITLLICLLLFFISDLIIILLFTSRFSPSAMALKLLLPGVLFLSISKILGSDLAGRGFPQYTSIASGISLIVTIVFDLLLIPRFGINGASLASSISYFASSIVIIYLFIRISHVKLYDILILKSDDFKVYGRIIHSLRDKDIYRGKADILTDF